MITLRTLPKASMQRVFNQVANHLLKQGRKAQIGATCQYLTNNGLKCAVGCLIGNKEYRPEWEGKGWRKPICSGDVAHLWSVEGHLLDKLQTLHDENHPNSWRQRLKYIANRFGLSTRWLRKK